MIKIKKENGETVAGPFDDIEQANIVYDKLIEDEYNEENIHITNFK